VPHVVLVAGEASGDRLGAGLIRALRARHPGLRVSGIAGPLMREAGCEAWHGSDELAVMGLVEVLRDLPRLRRILLDMEQRLRADPPQVLVGIDAPDFNLRLEQRARQAGIRTVHYVSPSVWAWRPGRVKVIRRACDRVLCLLPFEAGFLAQHGIDARFVGHPLADELASPPSRAQARAALGLANGPAGRPGDGPVLALLPGSRTGEVQRLGPPFAATAAWLAQRLPGLRCVAPMARPALARLFREQLAAQAPGLDCQLLDGDAHMAMAASDAVLLASGTATLEAMLLERPMVVAYRVAPLTLALLRGLRLVRVAHFSLPNLLAGEALVPEFLQAEVTPGVMGPALLALLETPARRLALAARFRELGQELRRDASERAADAVAEYLAV